MTVSPLIIRSYCEEHLENIVDRGDTLFAKCPRCGKEWKHFNINVDANDSNYGMFFCYKCNFRGHFKFLVKYLEGEWKEAEELQEEYSTCITLDLLKSIHSDKPVEINEFGDWTVNTVSLDTKCRATRLALEYLQTRNVSRSKAMELEFRVAIVGEYKNYIIIPLYEEGQVKSFLARRYVGKGLRYIGPSRTESFAPKSDFLWGLDKVNSGEHIVLVEGVFDAIALEGHNPAALMGKAISDKQVEKVLDTASEVTVLLDNGAEEDARKIASRFVGFLPVKLAYMENGDPAENPEGAKSKIQQARDYI